MQYCCTGWSVSCHLSEDCSPARNSLQSPGRSPQVAPPRCRQVGVPALPTPAPPAPATPAGCHSRPPPARSECFQVQKRCQSSTHDDSDDGGSGEGRTAPVHRLHLQPVLAGQLPVQRPPRAQFTCSYTVTVLHSYSVTRLYSITVTEFYKVTKLECCTVMQ